MRSRHHCIVVPLDGSANAEHALPTAIGLAKRHNAALHLVRVYVPVAGVAGEYAMRYDATLDRELMRRAHDYLGDVAARLKKHNGTPTSTSLIEGPVAEAISKYAATVAADLLVMTTQGRGPLARFWLGSVSDELVRQSGIPILFVRPQVQTSDSSVKQPACRVLVPLDGSELAERILEPVLRFADASPIEVTLLQVITSIPEVDYHPAGGSISGLDDAVKRMRESERLETSRAEVYLARLADRLRGESITVSTRVVWNERPATAILDDAATHGVDLIALATRGQGGFKRLVLGSVADKVLRGSETAVLVYRPSDDLAGKAALASVLPS